MGDMNLAVRNVTGKDPDAYLSDYRNRNNARMQEVKEDGGAADRAEHPVRFRLPGGDTCT